LQNWFGVYSKVPFISDRCRPNFLDFYYILEDGHGVHGVLSLSPRFNTGGDRLEKLVRSLEYTTLHY
jgi:hypothetical protein